VAGLLAQCEDDGAVDAVAGPAWAADIVDGEGGV
jgi:hypothetical protein